MINSKKRSEFVIKYKFSSAEPLNPAFVTINAHDFTMAIRDFLLENFRGLIDIDTNIDNTKDIRVSLEYVAFFLKTIIFYVHARRFIKISIESKKDWVEMLIDFGNDFVFEDNELRNIIIAVRNSGMHFSIKEDKFMIIAQYTDIPSYRIYALNPKDGYRRTLYSLREIFFCGPPMVEKSE